MITQLIGRLALLTGVLVLCIGCGDSPLTPADLAAQSEASPGFDASDRELLIAILDRLDSIEERVELTAQALDVRLDSMVARLLVLSAAQGAAQAQGVPFAQLLARSDSIISLADSIISLDNLIVARTGQIIGLLPKP